MKNYTMSKRKNLLKTIGALCFVMVLGSMTNSVHAQNTERTVTGVVQTPDGPLQFASVVLKGTTVGVATDEDGSFTFPKSLKENDVLVISSMAYDDIEVVIESNTIFIEPFLEGNPVVIIASLRTAPNKKTSHIIQD